MCEDGGLCFGDMFMVEVMKFDMEVTRFCYMLGS